MIAHICIVSVQLLVLKAIQPHCFYLIWMKLSRRNVAPWFSDRSFFPYKITFKNVSALKQVNATLAAFHTLYQIHTRIFMLMFTEYRYPIVCPMGQGCGSGGRAPV